MPAVGQDIAHDSAATHVTGQSVFLDDLAPLAGELVAGVVPSPVARGGVRRLDLSAVAATPGVVAVLTAADVPGHNDFGPAIKDEKLIVDTEAVFLGQPLAIIAAESLDALHAAAKAAVVEMEELPPVLSIDAAIEAGSFLGQPRHMSRGDVDAGFAAAAGTVEGVLEIGGQEHFYLESQVAIAVPGEQGQMVVYSSTQHPSEVQMMVAEALGVPFNHVTCVCKRMGGGFGGKETQAAQPAMVAALLAARTGRPVRFAYTKDDDMRWTGKRHPFKAVYRAGFDAAGRLTAVDVKLYSDGGCSTDLSFAVLERAMLHLDNAYYLPNVRIEGRVCKTNLPSNTAFRGFGGPQGVAAIENIMEEVATALGLDALDVRRANLYGVEDRNVTHYGQLVRNNTLPRLFDAIREEADYGARRKAVASFNESSPTHLKGLAVSPVKFGISFTRRTMNQANALVNVYQDGSVIVSTGATEMGQGVNTRIRQVVADALGIPYAAIVVTATSTDKNNNTSPTAASAGTDLNGAAAADACSRIRQRLAAVAAGMLARPAEGLAAEPDRVSFADGRVFDVRAPQRSVSFRDVCCAAYEARVSLGERGFYATPGVDFNRETGKGSPFLYYTNGVACSEVLVDRFTGEMAVTRVDLIMDVGKPLNPGIDRGQVVGGFVQGMGWVTTEQLVYGPKGQLLSYSPTTYKIPNASDVPPVLNVRFLDNPDNDVSLHRSKAVGEPPLLLGLSVWLAAKDAVRSAAGGGKPVALRLPATGEEMLRAIEASRPARALATV
ncbi:MAG TPA: xanthine dehydrogenase molybdopterin binding subunit [Humisphaera sp.]